MSRITSGVGLVTGIPIEDTVNQLMAISARPRDILVNRTEGLQAEQLALDTLSTRILSLQFDANRLASDRVYQSTDVSSSNPDALVATLQSGANPSLGSYALQPVRTASAQQFISQRFESLEDAFDDGSFSFRVGGFVNKGVSLDALNGGTGVSRGVIRITDRSGASADVDLSLAQSVDDVLDAINRSASINVTAEAVGDALRLTDHTIGGGSLSVVDIGGGTTAAQLGIGGISTTSASATGLDVFKLHSGTRLSDLNDQNGVYFTDDLTDVDDLIFTLTDGSTDLGVDLSGAKTLGDVVDAINEDEDLTGKVSAAVSTGGRRLELTDLTSGAGSFSVSNGVLGTAADDLGLGELAAGGVIAGRRLSAGLSDTLLASLNGGLGVGELGLLSIADRNGGSDTVDLSGAETLGEVIEAINSSAANVRASFNAAGNGVLIADASGGTGNLTLANADATNSADLLRIAVDDVVASSNSGGLNRQSISEATLLSSLNGGQGVDVRDIKLVDSQGVARTVNLDSPGNEATTVGDVINAIGSSGATISARINDTGDGVLVSDTGGGPGFLLLSDNLGGNVAASLNLTRTSVTIDDETPTQVVDGSAVYKIGFSDLEQGETGIALSSLNGGAGVAAGDFVITDSSGVQSLAIDLNGSDSGIATVDQLIDAINQKAANLGVGVTASLNASQSGILLTDTAGGPRQLTVRDVNSTTASDLRIAKAAVANSGTQTIDGAGAFTLQSNAKQGIEALAQHINSLDAGVVASTIYDGTGHRLVINVTKTGAANELLIDAGSTSLQFVETSQAQDALLLYGSAASASNGLLLSSSDNEFDDVINGVSLEVQAASDAPVTVSVDRDEQPFLDAVQSFVDSFNVIRDALAELTNFDAESETTGLLFGTTAALQVDSQLSRVLTDRFFGVGAIQTFEQLGLSVDDKGRLELDSAKLQDAFSSNSLAVREFLSNGQNGAVAKLTDIIDRLAGDKTSVLGSRSASLQRQIESNEQRIDSWSDRLDRERERLLLQFFQLEEIIAGLQQNLTALNGLQPVPPLSSS